MVPSSISRNFSATAGVRFGEKERHEPVSGGISGLGLEDFVEFMVSGGEEFFKGRMEVVVEPCKVA
jgi:hypothetical protein